MSTRSIAPMCILVKDHSRVLCEQLQQLRLQSGLVDLDIVCEDHHINVHKVVMAACSKFFKDQLCKQNVQVPVILRLEDFGLELKRDAVSYIIEFVYRGEVNIPGEKLTEVCEAAHTLGVVGLEHLPVPAGAQRPALINKDHLQIADESELRRDMNNIYNSFNGPSHSNTQPVTMNKFSMDMNNINPFFMNNNPIQNDDIILLQSADEATRNINNDADIIPISFGDNSVVTHTTDMSHSHQSRLYQGGAVSVSTPASLGLHDKMNLIVSDTSPSHVTHDQYRIIPEILSDTTFHEETIDSCLAMFPTPGNSGHHTEPQALSPAKSQDPCHSGNGIKTPTPRHQGKNISSLQQSPVASTMDNNLPVSSGSGHQSNLQALFDVASNELNMSSDTNVVFSSAVSQTNVTSSSVTTTATHNKQSPTQKLKPGQKTPVKGENNSLSQGKLRVINQGIHSENIQSPSCLDKTRRRSGQVSGCGARQDQVTVTGDTQEDPDQEEIADEPSDSDESDALMDNDADTCQTEESTEFSEIWSGNKSWTHPVESVDTSVPTSGAVWQLPQLPSSADTQLQVSSGQWKHVSHVSETVTMSRNLTIPAVPVVSGIAPLTTTIPWNTPVTVDSPQVMTTARVVTGSRDTPPSVSVSWTQPQSSACPSPGQQQKNLTNPSQTNSNNMNSSQQQIILDTNSSSSSSGGQVSDYNQQDPNNVAGPSWKNNLPGSSDNMLAIRSGIPLALQNKAIRSGVPIGPFQNKRKRKSRCSQEGSNKTNKRKTASSMSVGQQGKRGDLEVRKDLILDPHDDLSNENVFVNDESCASTSNIISKTKQESVDIRSPVSSGGVHIKTVTKLNSDPVEFEIVTDLPGGNGIASENSKFPFSCYNCPRTFPTASLLKKHQESVHNKDEPLMCSICHEMCLGNENLKIHMYKSHAVGELFRCEECSFESPIKSVYIKHVSEHAPEEDSKKSCPKCKKVFKTKVGLNMHLKQHFDDSLFCCKSCDFKTPQKLNLIKHTASKHGQDIDGNQLDATFSCEFCELKFIAEHMLKNHVMRKHTQKSEMRFRCELCNYATVEKAALDKHMRFKHTNERPYMCDTCGFSTHTASAMARHKRSHTNTKPHKCDICGHEYADKKRLRDHMYTHTDHKPFQCQLCTYTCRRKDNLSAHLKKNHDMTKPEKLEKVEVFAVPDSTSNHPVPGDSGWTTPPELEPPKPVWVDAGHLSHVTPGQVVTVTIPQVIAKKSPAPVSSISVSTLALGDLVPSSANVTDHVSTYTTHVSHVSDNITYSVDSSGNCEEVIFVPQSEEMD